MMSFFPRLFPVVLLCAALYAGLGVSPAQAAAPVTVQGGNGGGPGVGGTDNPQTDNTTTSFDSITVTGGNTGTGSAGDEGGNAKLIFSAGTTVTSTGAVTVISGTDGALGSYSGVPELDVWGTLIAPSITLDKSLNGGDARIVISTLDVTSRGTTLTSIGLTASGDFSIANANLAGGHQLSIDNSRGALAMTNLNVTAGQSGRLFVANGANLGLLNLHADNAHLTFVLPAALSAGDTHITVYQNGGFEGVADLTGTTIGLDYHTVRPNLAVGEQFTLLHAVTTLNTDITTMTVRTPNGDVYTLNVSGNDLLAVLGFISPTTPAYERLKAYAESRAGNLAFVNQGTDLLMGQGFGSALATTAGDGPRVGAFSGFGGGSSRYDTGSHVDVNGASLLAGLAWGNDVGSGGLAGRLTLGAFFEGGWGNYDSHNSFSNAASVKGDGDTSYYGGGVLGRYDLRSGLLQGVYFDASARLGRAESDFNSNDIKYNGLNADFDSSSMYYGLHGGLGYQWQINEQAMLDLSGKLLWTRQEGDSVNVHGDRLRFKDSDSLRTRLGGRFNYALPTESGAEFTPYAGAYWEHEFDGKARSTVNGVGIDAPTLEGNTGVGELGVSFKPAAGSAFSADLGVQGYTGVREGVTGSVQLKWEF